MDVHKRLDLLLIGKTGHGKSATGNSILGKKDVFDTNNSTSSVRKQPQCEQIMFEGRAIHVVDTHSDTSKDKSLVDAIAACRQGFHAILFVVKYGSRFTEQDEEAIEMLKELFGNCFLRDHGIIIMCNGDSFKRETREPTLESYCNNVTGPFKQLLDECGNRIVLFDNTTKDESEQHQQVKNLLDMVDRLPISGKRYMNRHLMKAAVKLENILAFGLSLFSLAIATAVVSYIAREIAQCHNDKSLNEATTIGHYVVIYHQHDNSSKTHAARLEAHTVSAQVRLFPSVRFPGTDNKEDPIFNPTSHSILELNEQATDNIYQHATGVNITREGIQILITGFYFVYSSVFFKPNSTRFSADFHYQTWFQYISRQSATSPVLSGVLLRTVHTCCSNCTGSQETAYTGAVFYLRTDDLIQMSFSGQGLIDFSAGASYLGLYLLHDDV